MPNDAALPQAENVTSVRMHAEALKDKLVAEGKIQPDAQAAAMSAGLPTFSKGTATLDPNTGQPVAPAQAMPEFSTEKVAPPAATETTGGTQPATPAPADAAPATPAAQTPEQQQAAASAADAAAQQVIDDLEELLVEEPDYPDIKIPVKVPKQYAQIMKRAIPRRADYDRIRQRWGEAAPVLEPLLSDGRMRGLLPLIQHALQNPAYGDAVWSMYQRSMSGLPLTEQIQQAVQQATQLAQTPAAAPGEAPLVDPFLEEYLKNDPRFKQLETMQQRMQAWEAEKTQREQRERQEAERNQQIANQLQGGHSDLAQWFPGQYNTGLGPNDPNYQKAVDYMKRAGYDQTYGVRAGLVFAGQVLASMEQERLAATASPAAQVLQAVDQHTAEIARQQAAALAAPGAGSATQASTPSTPPPKPSRYQADGKTLKPAEQFLSEIRDWNTAMGNYRG